MKTDQQMPDQPEPQRKVTILARDSITNIQVNTLLQITNSLSILLLNPTREASEGGPELDGGVIAAAEATFIKCCATLDNVLEEKNRWSMDMQNILEFQLGQAYASQTEFYKAQTALTNLAQSPHHRYKPTLAPTTDGSYIAFIGSINDLEHSIYGLGESPEAAMRAFDEVFSGKLPDSMVEWLASREAAAEAGLVPPDFPAEVKDTKQNEKHEKLDRKRSRKAPKPEKRRKNDPRNRRPDSGPVDQGS